MLKSLMAFTDHSVHALDKRIKNCEYVEPDSRVFQRRSHLFAEDVQDLLKPQQWLQKYGKIRVKDDETLMKKVKQTVLASVTSLDQNIRRLD